MHLSESCRARHTDMMIKRLILKRQVSGGELNIHMQGAKPQPRRTRPNQALVPVTPAEPR